SARRNESTELLSCLCPRDRHDAWPFRRACAPGGRTAPPGTERAQRSRDCRRVRVRHCRDSAARIPSCARGESEDLSEPLLQHGVAEGRGSGVATQTALNVPGASTLDAVRSIAPIIHEHREAIERDRLLPKAVARALIDAGVFRMLVPRSLDGDELDPITVCEVVEELSIHDGGVGWCWMIRSRTRVLGRVLPRACAGARHTHRGS